MGKQIKIKKIYGTVHNLRIAPVNDNRGAIATALLRTSIIVLYMEKHIAFTTIIRAIMIHSMYSK